MSQEREPARTGWGFDAHPLNDRPPVVLGGVKVSELVGVSATSDGDVLSHAVADAILGACVLGDLGEHFPSDDPSNANVSSVFILRQVATMAIARGWQVSHLDATVVAEQVRVAPYRDAIQRNLAHALGIDSGAVSVKATTSDGLGFIGRGEGIAAMAVTTVQRLS